MAEVLTLAVIVVVAIIVHTALDYPKWKKRQERIAELERQLAEKRDA